MNRDSCREVASPLALFEFHRAFESGRRLPQSKTLARGSSKKAPSFAALTCLVIAMLLLPHVALAQLEWHVSVKFILDANGNLPNNTSATFGSGCCDVVLNSRGAVETNIARANTILDAHGRGYRFVLDEVVSLNNVSQWFNVDARSETTRNQLEDAATADPVTYTWRTDAINVYINNTSSGYCSRPTDARNLIIIGSGAYDMLLIHEIGHYFNLIHTFQGEEYRNQDATLSPCTNGCACALLIAGDADEIADTIPDHQCWTRDQIAANRPGASGTEVDNVFRNIMSYHIPQDRFTSDQLDRMAVASNGPRANVTTGRTWWADRESTCPDPTGSPFCVFIFGGPFPTVTGGVNAANDRDIVLIRTGNYNEVRTFNKPVTLRASGGNVTIGLP